MNEEMFRPPVNRMIKRLDKSLFSIEAIVSAARVPDVTNVAKVRNAVLKSKDMLMVRNMLPIRDAPSEVGSKCILLTPPITAEDSSTWSPTIKGLVDQGSISLIPYSIKLNYENWTSKQILQSILPEELHNDIPTSYAHAGHIAHLNLREQYLPYRHVIGQVILTTTPSIRTVINKTEALGSENEFRILDHELLAGENKLECEVRESGSVFRFDYSKVFWNSRLGHEHERLVALFKPGEAVCDVMAGVGPFAIPAGKKEVFVWANDLNPDCHRSLVRAIAENKVSEFVQPFQMDGHSFIKGAATELLRDDHVARVVLGMSRTEAKKKGINQKSNVRTIPQPRVFSHYVMNLPSTAIDFLPNFIGLYSGHEELFQGPDAQKLPIIHCYCFAAKGEESKEADLEIRRDVCVRVSEKIDHMIDLDDEDLDICYVRDVAPNKRQLCVSFRLPAQVAFRKQ